VPRRTWASALLVGAPLLTALAARAEDPIRVYYDGGDCGTSAIELEVWDRAQRVWRAHPRHARVPVPSCQTEDAGVLWNEIRWRCSPSSGDRTTGWRPLQVFDAQVTSHCAVNDLASDKQRTLISVTSPAEGAVVRAREPYVELRGSVDIDGIAGSDYDVVLMVDRGTTAAALDAQIAAARSFVRRLAPRLGAVRIALLSYPGAQRELGWSTDARALDGTLAGLTPRSRSASGAVASALDAAIAELATARRSARAAIVMGVDGARLDASGEPAPDDPLVRAATRVGVRGAVLHWVALGGLAPEEPRLVQRALEHVRGSYRRVAPQEFATPFFDAIMLPEAEEVWVEAESAAPEVPAELAKDGAFRARVPVAGGSNTLVIHARTSDGAVVGRRLGLVFDDSLVPEKARAAQRKQIEMRPER
jgi:hypothetical protein